MPMLEIRNLSVTYKTGEKRIQAVRNVTLAVEARDSLGIVGESGSGKSTLAMAVLRLLPKGTVQVSGQVFFKGRDLMSLPELRQIRWKEIAVVFQKAMNALSPVHRLGQQMSDIYQVHEPGVPREQVKRRMLELLAAVNLPERVYNSYPHELSGGMMQRVSIALSLMHNPDLLILDEATTALDVVTEGQILENIMQLEQELNMTRIMVSHDISVIAATCKKVAVMYAGMLMETGLAEDVLIEPLHPYTQGLLRSFPSLTGEKKMVRGIPGSPPDLANLPPGCPFGPRCPLVSDVCREQEPMPATLERGRLVACHRVKGGAFCAE